MAKLGFSGDDDDSPIRVLYARKCKKTAGRDKIHDAALPGTDSDEEDDTYCPSEGSNDGSEYNEDKSNEVPGPEEGPSFRKEVNGDDSASVTLIDPDVLDCPICLESLTLPVFQVCQ